MWNVAQGAVAVVGWVRSGCQSRLRTELCAQAYVDRPTLSLSVQNLSLRPQRALCSELQAYFTGKAYLMYLYCILSSSQSMRQPLPLLHSPQKSSRASSALLPFLWQLFSDILQGYFYLINRLWLWLKFMVHFHHCNPDVIVQWVQIWSDSLGTSHSSQ